MTATGARNRTFWQAGGRPAGSGGDIAQARVNRAVSVNMGMELQPTFSYDTGKQRTFLCHRLCLSMQYCATILHSPDCYNAVCAAETGQAKFQVYGDGTVEWRARKEGAARTEENMSFKVSKVRGVPEFEALPVARIAEYPLEKKDYRPFAQNIVCVSDDALTVRMWAFEVSPPKQSELRAVFYLFSEQPEKALVIRAVMDEETAPGPECSAKVWDSTGKGAETPVNMIYNKDYSGEDLQGVYWGATVSVSLKELADAFGPVSAGVGDAFMGNFYKLCPGGAFEHYGSFFSANFSGEPYARDSMGLFSIVSW